MKYDDLIKATAENNPDTPTTETSVEQMQAEEDRKQAERQRKSEEYERFRDAEIDHLCDLLDNAMTGTTDYYNRLQRQAELFDKLMFANTRNMVTECRQRKMPFTLQKENLDTIMRLQRHSMEAMRTEKVLPYLDHLSPTYMEHNRAKLFEGQDDRNTVIENEISEEDLAASRKAYNEYYGIAGYNEEYDDMQATPSPHETGKQNE